MTATSMAPVTREQILIALKPVVKRIFICWTLEVMFGFIHIGLAIPTYYQINYDIRFLIIFAVTGGLVSCSNTQVIPCQKPYFPYYFFRLSNHN